MPTRSVSVLVPHLQLQLEPRLCPMPHHTCLNANLDKGSSRPGPEIEIYLGRNAEPDASLCWRSCSPGEVTQVGDRHWMKRVLTRRAGTRVRFGRFEFRVFLCLPFILPCACFLLSSPSATVDYFEFFPGAAKLLIIHSLHLHSLE